MIRIKIKNTKLVLILNTMREIFQGDQRSFLHD